MEPGGVLGDRYELTEMVGSGGVGEVWRAIDLVFDRTVAVKILRAEFSTDTAVARRFAVEARIMARLRHRGIAALYDSGQDPDGTSYLVMSFVDGESLRRILAREGPLPVPQVMSVVAEAADALEAAHAGGVIHRDVKPVNLLVRPDGSVVLTDFGIARAAGNDLTGVGLVVGTARYLAPEQAAGGELTPAVDIYALGVTAYECLTGEPPFDADDPLEVARQHVVSTPPRLPRTMPESVRDLVAAMLSKDPDDRPTAAEVGDQARAMVAGRSTAAHRLVVPSRPRRTGVLLGAGLGLVGALSMFALAAFAPNDPPDSRSDPPPPVVATNPVEPGATFERTAVPVPLPSAVPRTPGRTRTTGPVRQPPPAVVPPPVVVPTTASPTTSPPEPPTPTPDVTTPAAGP